MSEGQGTVSLVLFSGTDDKLNAAAVLAAGAVAMGRKVNVLLQYWALEAFHRDRIKKDHGVSADAGVEGAQMLRLWAEAYPSHWSDTLRQAKEIGELRIYACSLSMDVFAFTQDELDPLVDDIWGIASLWAEADGPVVFV